jgi:DNA (cytosine-5)-methyltransferase 1
MNELHLFAGAGGGILGGMLLGHTTVCAVEWDKYARQCLLARQRDGCLPRFPIWDDVQTFDGKPWRGRVDVVCGGFPCQDISAAGKGAGIDGARSGMWQHMARIVGEIRPRYVFVENSPMLTSRGLGRVLGDLAAMGYDAEWGVLGAHHVGAPHKRDRIWILANAVPSGQRREQREGQAKENAAMAYAPQLHSHGRNDNAGNSARGESVSESGNGSWSQIMAHATSAQRQGDQCTKRSASKHTNTCESSWWETEPDVGRVANGVASRVDRLRCIGNGQVPAVAALAFQILSARLERIQK